MAETEAFINKSAADVAKEFLLLDECTIINVLSTSGYALHMYNDDILQSTLIPPPNHAKVEKFNQKICVKGKMAFESQDQTNTLEDGPKRITYEIKVIQKVDNFGKSIPPPSKQSTVSLEITFSKNPSILRKCSRALCSSLYF